MFLQLTEYELCIASNLVEPLSMSVSWRDIGGLDSVINDIINSVILPFKHTSFIKSSALLKPPTGKEILFNICFALIIFVEIW